MFPDLRILSGLELGEPHWHEEAVNRVLTAGTFDRIIGSLHCLPDGDQFREPPGLYAHWDPSEVLRSYLAEIARLVGHSDVFSVLGHIDYPIRSWPRDQEPVDPKAFEDEFRHALRSTAQSGKALEINTAIPLHTAILQWRHEEGGDAVTFGSDAHDPTEIGHGFATAAALAEAFGFRPSSHPFDRWTRTS
jgi:histidinol-phosphatase (PHP family)